MMTLLLYLFVILYALAVMNKGEVRQTVQRLYTMFTGSSGSNEIVISDFEQAKKFIEENNLEGMVEVQQGKNGVYLELQEKVLFDSGSSSIKQESFGTLNKISKLIAKLPNDIIIAGHTDNLPINAGYFQSNWELSADRAVKILRYFTDTCKLAPKRFQPIGYGEYRPIADNNTAEGRQKNRRVEIVIIKAEDATS
jgi:chemotaxis protein MotB